MGGELEAEQVSRDTAPTCPTLSGGCGTASAVTGLGTAWGPDMCSQPPPLAGRSPDRVGLRVGQDGSLLSSGPQPGTQTSGPWK